MWSATNFDIYEPGTWIHSGGFAPMGYALPAAIAAKLARPEKQVVAICGDGGFQMLSSELAVSIENNAPIIVCIMNDGQLGIINLAQRRRYGARIIGAVLSRNPDFVKAAEAYGAEGMRIEGPSGFRPAVEKALGSDRTSVLKSGKLVVWQPALTKDCVRNLHASCGPSRLKTLRADCRLVMEGAGAVEK